MTLASQIRRVRKPEEIQMSRASRGTKLGVIGAAAAIALTLVGATAAHADSYIGSQGCYTNWSYTSATSTSSVTHYHEIPGSWKRVTRPAGYGNFKGWYQQGTVWMELSSSANLSTRLIACSS
jgi:hypothetical protein